MKGRRAPRPPLRMPVRDLAEAHRELLGDLEDMRRVVLATDPRQARYAKHLNRRGVIFCYAYYAALVRQELVDRDAVICDWGGQYGHVTRLLRRWFPNTICYLPDDSEFEAKHFHAGFGIESAVRFGPGYGHPGIALADASVDAVVSSGVLEHTREFGVPEAESLAEIRRILRPGGRLFVWNLPRRLGSVELLNKVLGRSVHPYTYTRAQVCSLLTDAGFEIDLVDAHEFLNLSSRNALGRLLGDVRAWRLDYYLSKAFALGLFRQHFTVVAHLAPERPGAVRGGPGRRAPAGR